MNDDSVDGDEDGDVEHDECHKALKAAAPAPSPVPSATLSGTPNAASLGPLPPAVAAPAANTLVRQEHDKGEGHERLGEEKEVTEQAHVEAVIAAASLEEDTAWNGGVRGGQPGVRQLLEGGHQPQRQQHPNATEAVSWKEGLGVSIWSTAWYGSVVCTLVWCVLPCRRRSVSLLYVAR